LEAIAAGDEVRLVDERDATERFYREVWPHAAMVLRTAQLLAREANEADELAQETLIKAFRAINSFRAGTDVKRWLLTILRNTRIDRLRAARAHQSLSLEDLESEPVAEESSLAGAPPANPDALLEEFSDAEMIAALRSLPEEIRWTLLLVDVEGIDHAEAAELLDVPVGTIKSRAHRGRAMLRQALLKAGYERRQ
jgi:RNA polymerase sigma-70 factor (ECF subfamily)